ncbi:uncharacterized protein LOC107737489 isoform X3 [Sinocyclocheilus rhinocerous]|uniref:uncharacterized protein LOC107737489 isoform X3 n=1 Tax=Sinocyclocheilus rhinocerous TaxID=307959 RepID=UPI0007BAC91B|nr:PREDICTED: uncharacterized protein LOC107737489 isoform X3 [Sinocyclocheilus rhinocerous]
MPNFWTTPFPLKAVQENEADSKAITKPGPESSLQTKTWFSLRTLEKMRKSDSNSEVIPKKIQLKYKPIKPNFFEVFVDSPKEDFNLQLMAQQHKEVVWDVKIRQAVGNSRVHEILLQHLEYLTSDELKLFKWHLTEGVEAFKKIPEGKLEKAERCTIVTCMTDQYEVDGAAKLTVMILKKMQKNNDAKQLQEKLDMKGTN